MKRILILAAVLVLAVIAAPQVAAQIWPIPISTATYLPYIQVPVPTATPQPTATPVPPTPAPNPCAPGLIESDSGIDWVYGRFQIDAYRWGDWPVIIAYVRDASTAQALAVELRNDPELSTFIWHVDEQNARIFGYLPGTPPELFTLCAPSRPAASVQAETPHRSALDAARRALLP